MDPRSAEALREKQLLDTQVKSTYPRAAYFPNAMALILRLLTYTGLIAEKERLVRALKDELEHHSVP